MPDDRPETFLLEHLEDRGDTYTGRITGCLIIQRDDVTVYRTDDDRVIVHDADKARPYVLDDVADELRNWLRSDGDYLEAMAALEREPVIDL